MLSVAADETTDLAVQRVLLQFKHIFGLVVNQAKSEGVSYYIFFLNCIWCNEAENCVLELQERDLGKFSCPSI